MHRFRLRKQYPSDDFGEQLAALDDNEILQLKEEDKLDLNEYFKPPHLLDEERKG